MDSESDPDSMAAYFSQVSKTIQVLKIEKEAQDDHDQVSISISTPRISDSEIKEKQFAKSKNKIEKDSKIDKIKLLEQKYKKGITKSLSISFSDIESEESLKGSDSRGELEAITHPDSPRKSEVYGHSQSQEERVQRKDRLSTGSRSDTKIENLVSNLNIYDKNEISQGENLFYSTNHMLTRRKSSTSLLLNKDSIFHSSSLSTDNKPRPKRTNSVIKFSKYKLGDSGSAPSNSVPTESVEEEISATVNGRTSFTESKIDKNVKTGLKKNIDSLIDDEKSTSSLKQNQIGKATSKVSKEQIRNLTKGKTSNSIEPGNRHTSDRDPKKKQRPRRKITRSTHHRYKDSPSTVSATSQQSCSSSLTRSSFPPTKRKRKKGRDEEIKQTESILEVVLKNLPYVIRESMSGGCFRHHSSANIHLPQDLSDIAASEEISWKTTNTRIDDALKQTIALTREFLDTHLMFVESYSLPEGYRYTSLKT